MFRVVQVEMFQALSGAGCRLLSLLGIPSRVDNDDDDPSIGRRPQEVRAPKMADRMRGEGGWPTDRFTQKFVTLNRGLETYSA